MKEKLINLKESIQDILKQHLNGENIIVPLSGLVGKSDDLLKAYESLEEDILLKRAGKKKIYTSRNLITNKKEVNKVAYFLARYEHFSISNIPRQTPAIRAIAEKLGVKLSSLRNKRDFFDSLVKVDKQIDKNAKTFSFDLTIREGWKQKLEELSPELQETYAECSDKTYEQLLKEVKKILEL